MKILVDEQGKKSNPRVRGYIYCECGCMESVSNSMQAIEDWELWHFVLQMGYIVLKNCAAGVDMMSEIESSDILAEGSDYWIVAYG